MSATFTHKRAVADNDFLLYACVKWHPIVSPHVNVDVVKDITVFQPSK